MKPLDIVLIILIAAAVFFACRSIWKNGKKGCGSCSNCENCAYNAGCKKRK